MSRVTLLLALVFNISAWGAVLCKQIDFPAVENPAEHTIHDLSGYITDNLGERFIELLRHGQKVFIALGDGQEAIAKLAARGFQNLVRIQKRVGFHQTWSAELEGKKVLIVTRVNGQDRLEHIRSFFSLLQLHPEIEIIGSHRSWEKDYLKVFEQISGGPPDLAVIGFSNTYTQSIMSIPTLLRRPTLAWQKIQALRQKKKVVATSDISTLPVQVIRLRNGQKIWFFQNVYGDLVLDIAAALQKYRVTNILYGGTAGSLSENFPVGKIVQPREWVDEQGVSRDLNWISELRNVPKHGRYERVVTPNVETKAWLQRKISEKVDLIEVEVGHLLRFFKGYPNVRFNAVLVVSDILVGNQQQDLTVWNKGNLVNLWAPFKDILASKLNTASEDLRVLSYEVYLP